MPCRRSVAILTLMAICIGSTANAQNAPQDARIARILRDMDFDHLKPETPFLGFSFPMADARKAYPDAFRPEIAARVFADLSFCCSILTTIERRKDSYRVVSVTIPATGIFPVNARHPRTEEPKRCSTIIPLALGDRVVAVWRGVLQRTRYGKEPQGGADGATYIFASSFMTGRTWSPPPESVPGKLVAVAAELQTVCEKKSAANTLDAATRALETALLHYQ